MLRGTTSRSTLAQLILSARGGGPARPSEGTTTIDNIKCWNVPEPATRWLAIAEPRPRHRFNDRRQKSSNRLASTLARSAATVSTIRAMLTVLGR